MSPPYQLQSTDARKEVVRRKDFYARKLQECEDLLHALDTLPSFLEEHPLPDEPPASIRVEVDTPGDTTPAHTQHRRKEDLYDEEMMRILARVKVATKMAVFQHFHRVLRGNTSIGAVESYLKRAVLRGVIVRLRRGEYALPPKSD